MYNETKKQEYLNSAKFAHRTRNLIADIFNKLESYEQTAGKDISEFSAKELNSVLYDGFLISKQSTYDNILSIINRYKEWVGAPTLKDSEELDGTLMLRKTMVSSPVHLRTVLDQGFLTADFETIDVIIRAMYWLLFMGLTPKQIVSVTKDDVDFNTMTVNCDGEIFLIEALAVESLRFACESEYIILDNPAYNEAVKRPRAEGSEILRCYTPLNGSLSNLRRRAYEIFQSREMQNPPVFSNIWYSGIFYRKFLAEMMGDEPEFESLARFLTAEKLGDESKVDVSTFNFKRKMKNLERDYNAWKLAFPRFDDLKNIFIL